MASYYLFLAVLFGRYSPGTPASEYFAFVAQNAIPLLCFAAIGIVGLRFWPTDRLWFLGLLAGVVQTSLAIWMFVDPKLMLNLAP